MKFLKFRILWSLPNQTTWTSWWTGPTWSRRTKRNERSAQHILFQNRISNQIWIFQLKWIIFILNFFENLGKRGDPGFDLVGSAGPEGIPGLNGVPGMRGDKGAAGLPGIPGLFGNCAAEVVQQQTTTLD